MSSFLPKIVGVGSVKLIRSFHRSCGLAKSAYEGEGKTTMTILNNNSLYGLMVNSYSTSGFQLNNGVFIVGPMIIFPKSVLGWNIASSNEITEESLVLFKLLEPSLDLLIVGLDQTYPSSTPFLKTLKDFTKKQNTSIEILPIDHACTTFNFLNAENRYIAAALLPPRKVLPKQLIAVKEAAMRRNLSKPEPRIEAT